MLKLACRLTACLCMSLLFGSCIFDYPPEMEGDGHATADGDKVVLQLNIRTLAASQQENPTEKIKSLRVVIIGRGATAAEPDTIECNRLLQLPEMVAKDYSYIMMWNSTRGSKDIFVIANEESVDDNLSTLLNEYAEKKPANGFADLVNGYSFTPQYTTDDKNNIYLPYSFSREEIEPVAGAVNTVNAWLVPVATKFIFNFTNNRPNGIKVNGISMKYANRANYLIARPGEGELKKEYNGQTLSWTDWLAEISKNSWLYPEFAPNEGYNDEVGWIIDYALPNPGDSYVYTFIRAYAEDEIFTVSGATSKEIDGVETVIPGRHSTRIYYLPESVNFQRFGDDGTAQPNPDGDQTGSEEPTEQAFYLTLLFEETAENASTPPVFNDIAIPNLKALFRNTYVVINITMSEGDIELYAEIAEWNPKTANGWVNEGDTPPNNPFSIKKKW